MPVRSSDERSVFEVRVDQSTYVFPGQSSPGTGLTWMLIVSRKISLAASSYAVRRAVSAAGVVRPQRTTISRLHTKTGSSERTSVLRPLAEYFRPGKHGFRHREIPDRSSHRPTGPQDPARWQVPRNVLLNSQAISSPGQSFLRGSNHSVMGYFQKVDQVLHVHVDGLLNCTREEENQYSRISKGCRIAIRFTRPGLGCAQRARFS